MQRVRSGFTLVELLVVITIIGLLIALLIPAVNMVREKGRQATCMNYQKQLGLGIMQYDTAQGKLPGVMNQWATTAGTIQYSWVGAISPHIEHTDIYENIRVGKLVALAGMRIASTVCPDDPYTADPTSTNAQNLLSYGINDQFFVDYRDYRNSIFRFSAPFNALVPPAGRNSVVNYPSYPAPSYVTVLAPNSSNLKTRVTSAAYPRGQSVTTTQTVMLGERNWVDPAGVYIRATKWYDPNWLTNTTPDPYWQALTFPYPTTSTVAITPGVMASSHGATVARNAMVTTGVPGTVVVVFYFDGHGAIVPSDTQFPQ